MFIQMYQEKFMRFPDGKCKALTFSYDDGVSADKRLIALFDRYGLKGTFNLGSSLFEIAGEWNDHMTEEETLKTYADCGHEIALHGDKHIFMNKVTTPEAIVEIVENRRYLERAFHRRVTGMAYAYNGYTDEIVSFLRSFGVKYARTTQSSFTFRIPRDWLRLQPTCHHNEEEMLSLAQSFFGSSPLEIRKEREPWLFYVWGHSYEFDREKGQDSWAFIEEFCQQAHDFRDEVWFATNGEIYDYVQAYDRLEFSCDGERVFNPSACPVWLELRGKTYCVPAGEELVFDAVPRKY